MEKARFFRVGCGLLLPMLLFVSCGKSQREGVTKEADATRHSWIGESESGLRVLCELLPKPHFPSEVRHTEEDVLRSRLGFGDDMALLRIHLVGPTKLIEKSGYLTFQGNSFHSFGYMPEDLSSSNKLLWTSVVQGKIDVGVSLGNSGHRSLLLWGEVLPTDPSVRLVWKGSGFEIPLEPRSWDESQRGGFLYSSQSFP